MKPEEGKWYQIISGDGIQHLEQGLCILVGDDISFMDIINRSADNTGVINSRIVKKIEDPRLRARFKKWFGK